MRTLVCFRTAGGVGRHPIEREDDLPALLDRLAGLVGPAEWWCEPEIPRGALVVEDDS